MNLIFLTKRVVYGIVFLLPFGVLAQEDKPVTETQETEKNARNKNYIVAISVGYNNLMPTGDNFAGQGFEAGSGFHVKTHLYVYDRIFAGVALGKDYLQVKNTELLGVYERTSISNQYVYLGYEMLLFDGFRLGVSVGLFGNIDYRNQGSTNYKEIKQKDSGQSNYYGVSLDYQLATFVFVYLDYSYRTDRTNIDTPQALEDFFERANYHNVAVGLRLRFGRRVIFK